MPNDEIELEDERMVNEDEDDIPTATAIAQEMLNTAIAPELSPLNNPVGTPPETLAPPPAPVPLPTMTRDQLIEKAPSKCPKCGAFVERVLIATDEHLPGYWCNKEGCGWSAPLPGELTRVCDYKYLFGESQYELIRVAPLNEEVRAMVHAIMLKPIPRSCLIPGDIIRWAECAAPAMFSRYGSVAAAAPPPQNTLRGFSAEVFYSYQASGHCNFTATASGSGQYEITRDEMLRLANEAVDLRGFRNSVIHYLKDLCNEDSPDTEYGNYRHEDYEEHDWEDHCSEVNSGTVERNLINWVMTNAPERARVMGL